MLHFGNQTVNRLRNLTRHGLDLTKCPRPFFNLMLKLFYSPEKKQKCLQSMHCKSMTHSWKSVDGSLDRCYVAMADSTLKSDGPESTNIRPGSTDGVHCSWQPRRLHTSPPLKTARLHVPPNNCASALFVNCTGD